jgi:DNA-binding transcriptional regulator WhiA
MRSTSNIKNTFSLNSKIAFDNNSSIKKRFKKLIRVYYCFSRLMKELKN